MKIILAILLTCVSGTGYAQKFLNLGFDYETRGTGLPQKWYLGQDGYLANLDEKENFNSAKSLKIKSNKPQKNQFGVCRGSFPIEFVVGQNIEFRGKIKTDSIKNGYAGLWWRVDGQDGTLGFDNMMDRGITGTNNWQDASIKMKVDEKVTNINFGALLVGEGTAWFDDFEVFIDGKKFIDLKPRLTEPTKEELAWLKSQIYPLKAFEPGFQSNNDLKVLKNLIRDSKVVALGEVTHGSSEIFKMKHRLVKYLAENEGFNIFSIEANMPESYKLNDYILDKKGDPTALIKGMHFWTWRTQEVLHMVDWMKAHNKSKQNIQFTGFDMQFYSGPVKELEFYLQDQPQVHGQLGTLKQKLEELDKRSKNTGRMIVSSGEKDEIHNLLTSINKTITQANLTKVRKDWLHRNTRIIEQYLVKNPTSRDKFMAENLMWIKSNNPKSKIAIWAHNYHIKKTGTSMGKYLADSLGNEYLTIGFTFHKGQYTAMGSNGLSNYKAQDSYPGTYEYFFNAIDEPIFILDLRKVKNDHSEHAKWLQNELNIRSVGAVKVENEFSDTNVTDNFDLLIFINESSSSTLLN